MRILLMLSVCLFAALVGLFTPGKASADTIATFRPGAALNDTSGSPLQAHGSDVVQFGGTYYWYGSAYWYRSAPRDTNDSLPSTAFGGATGGTLHPG